MVALELPGEVALPKRKTVTKQEFPADVGRVSSDDNLRTIVPVAVTHPPLHEGPVPAQRKRVSWAEEVCMVSCAAVGD